MLPGDRGELVPPKGEERRRYLQTGTMPTLVGPGIAGSKRR